MSRVARSTQGAVAKAPRPLIAGISKPDWMKGT